MKFYTNVHYSGTSLKYRQIKNGVRTKGTIPFEPCLYIPTKSATTLKTLDGRNVDQVKFNSLFELKEFKNTYINVEGFELHGDIGIEYQYISKEYGPESEYDFSQLKILYIDIETTCEDGFPDIDIASESVIVVSCMIDGKIDVYCLGQYDNQSDNVTVHCYDDEKQLLYDLVEYFGKHEPDIITGWNVRFFDIPYLVNRIKSFKDSQLKVSKLSPFGVVKEKKITKQGKEHTIFDIHGIATMDYYELYKTFTYVNQESYKLDHIAWVELGERKVSYQEYDSISDFYKKNFKKFVEYNIKDTELVAKLEKKMRLMELAVALAHSAGVNYVDVFSQVKTWDVIIYHHLLNKNIVIPPKTSNVKEDQYAGAYVKEPQVGRHKWVVSFDIASMYPNIIIQNNISPETMVEQIDFKIKVEDIINPSDNTKKVYSECVDKDVTISANGTCYTKDTIGFLPELMDKMFKERKKFKNKMIESKQKLELIDNEIKLRGLMT